MDEPAAAPPPAAPGARLRAVPLRYILPNLVTLIALCLGLTAIRFAIEARFEHAIIAIVAAAILDGLDGRLARALKGTSRFGAELDSLADFVDFGVAPGVLLYVMTLHQVRGLGWFVALAFAIACALRLARFNVTMEDPEKPAWAGHFFTGMPAPAGAIVGLLPAYLHILGAPVRPGLTVLECAWVFLVALLMASRIPHYSGKSLGRVPREYVLPVLFGVAVFLLALFTFPMEVLVAVVILYVGLIPFSWRRQRELARQDAEAAAAANGASGEV